MHHQSVKLKMRSRISPNDVSSAVANVSMEYHSEMELLILGSYHRGQFCSGFRFLFRFRDDGAWAWGVV